MKIYKFNKEDLTIKEISKEKFLKEIKKCRRNSRIALGLITQGFPIVTPFAIYHCNEKTLRNLRREERESLKS